jgi:hypothetical protein
MTGEHAALLVLRNRTKRACALGGYPSVRLVDRAGRTLRFRVANGRGSYVTHARPRLFLLRPGRRAWFLVAKYRCDRGDATESRRLDLSLGGVLRAPVRLAFCRGGRSDPGNVLQLSPFVARAEAALPR